LSLPENGGFAFAIWYLASWIFLFSLVFVETSREKCPLKNYVIFNRPPEGLRLPFSISQVGFFFSVWFQIRKNLN
jgi:hypothetical protein